MVLFIILYKVVHTFESVNEILKCDDSNEIKATEQYFPVVLFIMLYRVVLVFESVDEILKCSHSNEGYRAAQKKVLWLTRRCTNASFCTSLPLRLRVLVRKNKGRVIEGEITNKMTYREKEFTSSYRGFEL